MVAGVHKELIANLRRLNDPAASDDSITTEDAVSWIDAAAAALEATESPATIEWGVRDGDNFRGFGVNQFEDFASCNRFIQCPPLWFSGPSNNLVIVSRIAAGPWEVAK